VYDNLGTISLRLQPCLYNTGEAVVLAPPRGPLSVNVDPEFKLVLEKWGSEKSVHAFLKREFDRINRAVFDGSLEIPELKINPNNETNSTGNYMAADRYRPAVIGIFVNVLKDEARVRRALAHYIVHYWENTLATDKDSEDYPTTVDEEISKEFSTGYRERAWRSTHSRRFIAKACDVAKALAIPVREVLLA